MDIHLHCLHWRCFLSRLHESAHLPLLLNCTFCLDWLFLAALLGHHQILHLIGVLLIGAVEDRIASVSFLALALPSDCTHLLKDLMPSLLSLLRLGLLNYLYMGWLSFKGQGLPYGRLNLWLRLVRLMQGLTAVLKRVVLNSNGGFLVGESDCGRRLLGL
jgi:hypothetical protein